MQNITNVLILDVEKVLVIQITLHNYISNDKSFQKLQKCRLGYLQSVGQVYPVLSTMLSFMANWP